MALEQRTYNIGNDNATGGDPDTCMFDGADTPRTGQSKESNFMVRIGVANTGSPQNNRNYSLYFNTVDNAATATQVTTSSSIVKISAGSITDGANCTDELCTAQPETFDTVGEAIDVSNETSTISLGADDNMECQFCVQFDTSAGGDTTYYFYLREEGDVLDSNVAAEVTTETDSSSSSSSRSSSSSSKSSSSTSALPQDSTNWKAYMIILGEFEGVYSQVQLEAFSNAFSTLIEIQYPKEHAQWVVGGSVETWYWYDETDLNWPRDLYMPWDRELTETIKLDDEPTVHKRIIKSLFDLEEDKFTGMYFLSNVIMIWGTDYREMT